MAPTPTRPQVISHLLARQEQQQPTATVVVDSGSSDGGSGSSSGSSLNGGAIAGIVIGSTVGILLLWWIIRACAQPRSPDSSRQGWYDDTALPPPAPLPPPPGPGRDRPTTAGTTITITTNTPPGSAGAGDTAGDARPTRGPSSSRKSTPPDGRRPRMFICQSRGDAPEVGPRGGTMASVSEREVCHKMR